MTTVGFWDAMMEIQTTVTVRHCRSRYGQSSDIIMRLLLLLIKNKRKNQKKG